MTSTREELESLSPRELDARVAEPVLRGPAPYSRAAWESWQDIHDAVNARLIESPPHVWGCPNNPFVIIVNRAVEGAGV